MSLAFYVNFYEISLLEFNKIYKYLENKLKQRRFKNPTF